jgi:hypothetical protein
MAAPKFTVTYLDGTSETVSLRPRAQIQFEEDTGGGLVSLDDEVRVSKLYKLAWYAAGKPGEFDEWLDNLEAVELPQQEETGVEGDSTHPT